MPNSSKSPTTVTRTVDYGALLETDPDLHLSRALRQDAAP